jgi:hypothetical protein
MDPESDQAGPTDDAKADPSTDSWRLDLVVRPTSGEIVAIYEYVPGDEVPVATIIRNLMVIPAEALADVSGAAQTRRPASS